MDQGRALRGSEVRKRSHRETAMFANPFGYITIIAVQQVLMVGLAWYIMHLLDSAWRERRRQCSKLLFSNIAASCDLAALSARLSKIGGPHLDAAIRPAKVRIRQEERV